MRHVGEAEAAIAVGVDRRPGRDRTPAPGVRHGLDRGAVGALFRGLGSSGSSARDLRPKLIRIGPATMIEEYMPTSTPKVMAMVKPRMTSPPKNTSGNSARNTVN